jgi:hypothetical protein
MSSVTCEDENTLQNENSLFGRSNSESSKFMMARFNKLFQTISEQLKQQIRELDEERELFEEQSRRIQDMIHSPEDVIHLNVGGKKFTTFRSTLTKHKESMLATMFSGQFQVTKDEKGRIVLDRDPKYFRSILNYLRTDYLPRYSTVEEREEFKRELRYFGLEDHYTSLVEPSADHICKFNGNILDRNGVFYYLGTDEGCSAEWRNPALTGIITIECSSVGYASPDHLTDRDYTSENYSVENVYHSLIDVNPNITITFNQHEIRPNGYLLCVCDRMLLRNWRLDGQTTNSSDWICVSDHVNDQSLQSTKLSHYFTLKSDRYFSRLRITVTGKCDYNGFCFNSHMNNYSITQIEFYGFVRKKVKIDLCK